MACDAKMTEEYQSSNTAEDVSGEEKIVFTDEEPSFLEDDGYELIETYKFGRQGYAAKVRVTGVASLSDDDRVNDVEDADREFSTMCAVELNDEDRDRLGSIEDYRRLNNVKADGNIGEGVTVAVMDTGVDETHRLFDGMEIEKHNFTDADDGDEIGHGTAVMGQVVKFAPGINPVSLKVFGDDGGAPFDAILSAYEWLTDNAHRVDLANLSLGIPTTIPPLDDIHNNMVYEGIRDCTAAGNSGNQEAAPGSPATASKSFTIGATDENGDMAGFSSAEEDENIPDVVSIGKNCRLAAASNADMGTDLQGPWVKASGTSFSSPAVCGIAAKFIGATDGKVKEVFNATATDVEGTVEDGNGLVNYEAAMDEVSSTPPDEPDYIDEASAAFWTFAGNSAGYIDAGWPDSSMSTARLLESESDRQLIELLDE